jgi:hypothetical protein
MSSPEERCTFKELFSPIGRTQLGLAASFVTPSQKKGDEGGDKLINDEPFVVKKKPKLFKQ